MQNILRLMGYMRPYWKQATIGPLMKLIEVRAGVDATPVGAADCR